MRKTKHQIAVNHAPQVEFAAAIGQAFNLAAPIEAPDPWKQEANRARLESDRARADLLQVDMFPDCENPAPRRNVQRRD